MTSPRRKQKRSPTRGSRSPRRGSPTRSPRRGSPTKSPRRGSPTRRYRAYQVVAPHILLVWRLFPFSDRTSEGRRAYSLNILCYRDSDQTNGDPLPYLKDVVKRFKEEVVNYGFFVQEAWIADRNKLENQVTDSSILVAKIRVVEEEQPFVHKVVSLFEEVLRSIPHTSVTERFDTHHLQEGTQDGDPDSVTQRFAKLNLQDGDGDRVFHVHLSTKR